MKTNDYPSNWREIANSIKDKSEWLCEHCDHPHEPKAGYTLTVHHLNGNKADCCFENLVALCQRCHLRIQAKYVVGQQWLFDAPEWAIKRGLVLCGG